MKTRGVGFKALNAFALVIVALDASRSVAIAQDLERLVNWSSSLRLFESYAIATDGTHIAVGFKRDSGYPYFHCCSGLVQIFGKTDQGWIAEQVIYGERFEFVGERFGAAIALNGNWMAIGAPGTSVGGGQRGRVHMYERVGDEWILRERIQPPGTKAGSLFGAGLAFSGDRLIAGAPGPNIIAGGGAVYCYILNEQGEWNIDQVVRAPSYIDQGFGSAIAATPEQFVLGIPNADALSPRRGSALVYHSTNGEWELLQILRPNTDEQRDFGASVSISNGVIVVGDPYFEKVYVFEQTTNEKDWQQTFAAPNGGFVTGDSVATNGDVIFSSGRAFQIFSLLAYVRSPDGWVESFRTHHVPGLRGLLSHGEGLAASNDFIALSAGNNSSYPWSAYVVNIDPHTMVDCNGNGTADAIDVIANDLADCNANGIPDECEPGAEFDCNGNGICDRYDVYWNDVSDCNGNLVPDECETSDVDGDGVNDVCDNCPEIPNPGQEDCDDDGVGDVCAIASGLSEDCDEDGVPDECGNMYQSDPPYTGIWAVNGFYDALFIQDFVVQPGQEFARAIDLRWPTASYGESPARFHRMEFPVILGLFRDPDHDGNPRNALLIRRIDGQTGLIEGGWKRYLFDDTYLGYAGEKCYVGFVSILGSLNLPDSAECSDGGQAWAGPVAAGSINLEDLSNNSFVGGFIEEAQCRAIRVVPSLRWRCECTADIASSKGRGGDGFIDIFDVLALLSAWGDCDQPCPPSCVGDFSDDCKVDVFDLFMLLREWGPCE